jgi:hypothetical protein
VLVALVLIFSLKVYSIMDLITITAIDLGGSSDTMTRTFNTENLESMSSSVLQWEKEIPFRRYELTTDELIQDDKLEEVLDMLEVTI